MGKEKRKRERTKYVYLHKGIIEKKQRPGHRDRITREMETEERHKRQRMLTRRREC